MKKIVIIVFAAIMAQHSVFAWGELGHEVIVEIAQRHLTDKAKAISLIICLTTQVDAVRMDIHRRDGNFVHSLLARVCCGRQRYL